MLRRALATLGESKDLKDKAQRQYDEMISKPSESVEEWAAPMGHHGVDWTPARTHEDKRDRGKLVMSGYIQHAHKFKTTRWTIFSARISGIATAVMTYLCILAVRFPSCVQLKPEIVGQI